MAAEWELQLGALRQSLQREEDVAASLTTLNTLLEATTSGARTKEIASFVSLQLLFEILSSVADDSDELRDLTCGILGKIFSALSPAEVCSQRIYLELGLQHENEAVRRLSLEAITRHVESEEMKKMMKESTVFHLLTQIIGDQNLHCAELAQNLLLSILETPSSLSPSLKSGLLLDLEGAASKSDIIRFRVYDLVVTVSLRNEDSFEFSRSTGLLGKLLEEMRSEDVLVQMNCVELMLRLLEKRQGVRFLESHGVVRTMHSLLMSTQDNPLGSVLLPSILKFYGHIAVSEESYFADVNSQYPEYLSTVLTACLTPGDETVWGVAVDTFGHLGSRPSGRVALEAVRERTREVVKSLGEVIASGRPNQRVRALQSFSVFFSYPPEVEEEEEETEKGVWSGEKYFNFLGQNLFPSLLKLLQQPFDELCTATLTLLRSLAGHKWGQKVMSQQPGLLEYLLDRKPTLSKTGKETKYDIVSALVNSTTAEEYFGSPNFLKLRIYYREGPFFTIGEQVVQMEESAE